MNPYRQDLPTSKPRSRGTGSRILWLLMAVGFAAFLIARTNAHSESTATAAGPVKMARLNARNVQETAELNGIEGGAAAGMAYLAAKESKTIYVSTPRTIASNATKLNLRGIRSTLPHAGKEKALADAIAQAHVQLSEALLALDPPIQHLPSEETLRAEYLVPGRTVYLEASEEDQEAWKQAGLEPNRVWAKVEIEVSESQLRHLHGKDRLLGSAKWFAGAMIALLIGFGFLRLDALTKGHLTLALGIAALGVMVAAATIGIFWLRAG